MIDDLADDRRHVGNNGHTERAERIALKMPPVDPAAELSVVVCEMHKPGSMVAAGIDPADLYSPKARELFEVVESLRLAGAPASLSTVRHFVQMDGNEGIFERLGGLAILEEIEVREIDVTNFNYYAGIVREKSRRRMIKERALAVANAADDDSKELGALIEQADFSDLEIAPADAFTLRALRESYPHLNPTVIDRLIRRAEVANIIAPTKIGKSWLAYGVSLSVVTGRDWFGFPTQAGRVLLIDNELHRATIGQRLVAVGEAMGLRFDDYADFLSVWPLRGKGADVYAIGRRLNRIPRGFYSLIVVDAKYRAIPSGTSENDNASEAHFYNELDRWAERLDSAVAVIHHSTKGDQSDKRVTDVGAGGGAQSRAADTHIVIREHENPGVFVLDAAVRSFAPIEPIAVRFEFPLWIPDEDADPTHLKSQPTRQQERQERQDSEAEQLVLDACATWQTEPDIRRATGLGGGRTTRAIGRLLQAERIQKDTQDRPRNHGSVVYRRTIHG
jgi:AAA domain/DnaB-like helicase N terminal domain